MDTQPDSLRQILKDELRYSNELLEILYKEREALTDKDPDIVRQIAADKQQIAIQLEFCAQQRDEYMRRNGYQDAPASLTKVINLHPEATALRSIRSKLQVVLEQCKKQNQINGSILDGSQRGIQQALNILRGQTPPTEVYNKSGVRSQQPQRSTLTKA